MNKIDSKMMAVIKESLKSVGKQIEKRPMIFIDAKGKYWFNSHAGDLISKEGIRREDFEAWLKIGSAHLQNFRCGQIGIQMIGLPGKSAVVLLENETRKDGFEKFRLSRKEKEILCHLVKGFSNKNIADSMKISPGTVNTHLDNIYSKLGCSNRVSACRIALKNGLFFQSR
jgi:DNA-binding CsgD family transcriptional regulator